MAGEVSAEMPAGVALGLRQPRRQSLAEEIADNVAEAIATRHLMPGERIVEMALAEQMQVSRVPVREALKVLHAQGIVSGGAHRGYRVAAFDEDTVRNVVEVRLMLESILLRNAIANWRAGRGDLSDLRAAVGRMETAAIMGDRLASLAADLDFHRAISVAAKNDIAATLWQAIARHVLIIFNREEYREGNLDTIVAQHRGFLGFIETAIAQEIPDEEIERGLKDHLFQVSRAKQTRRDA